MSPKAKAATTEDEDAPLKRLPGVGWQTRDGRFTIATASGTWSVTDEEQTDDLGLPLVRGPFRSLTDAKAAIEAARSSEPATSDLAARARAKAPASDQESPAPIETVAATKTKPKAKAVEEPEEARWISELEPADRRRARQLIRRLEERGVRDPEGVVRRDLAGNVPNIARIALADRLAAVLDDADPAAVRLAGRVLDALGDDRDDDLNVRWRVVDDEGRLIGVSIDDVTVARKRLAES